MSGFDENGFHKPGTFGRGVHLGDPLTAGQIRELPDGAEVVITWCGGNGPAPYRILVDTEGARRVENLYPDALLPYDAPWRGELQPKPFHRVTLGWDDATRALHDQWHDRPEPEHIRAQWARLRGIGVNGLTAWIAACVDEDEATARHSGPALVAWVTVRGDAGQMLYTTVAASDDGKDDPWIADGHEVNAPASARVVYDPARLLREVTARRAILARHAPDEFAGTCWCSWCSSASLPKDWPCPDVLDILAVYSDQPGYGQFAGVIAEAR